MTIYRSIVAFLAALSADPAAIDQERPRAAAAVAVAYAQVATEEPPAVSETEECEGDNCPVPEGVVKP